MSDELDNLKAEQAKLKDICANPNASNYHKKCLEDVSNKINALTGKPQPKQEQAKKEETSTVEAVEKENPQSS